jgi:hypothetical protein
MTESRPALGCAFAFAIVGRSGHFRVWTIEDYPVGIPMSECRSTKTNRPDWASACITVLLVASAVVTQGYWALRSLDQADTEAMESPLMLSVAHQLVAGPGELYGPFGRSNPLVLIHAPLYYRAAAVLAWPMARAGLHPVAAARVAGRALSAACLIASMGAAYRLGRLGGLPRRAGWWAALLLAASPVLAGQPVAVRPDMAGVALQSWGVALALESFGASAGRPARRLGWASALFGLAVCVKQHLVVGWTVGAAMAVWGWMRGRTGPGGVAWILLPGAVIAGMVYGAEWVVTKGRVWDAVVVAAAHVRRIHPGDWNMVALQYIGIGNPSAGAVAMLAAPVFILAARRPGAIRWIATGLGLLVIGILLAAVVNYLVAMSNDAGGDLFLAMGPAAAVTVLSALWAGWNASPLRRVDAALWACLAAELGLITLLSYMNAGAWINYAIPATVFAAALASRTLVRALEIEVPALVAAPAVLAAIVVLASNVIGLNEARQDARVMMGSAEVVYEHVKRPRSSFFFANRPGLNRLNGRLELVYDDWLYPVFEAAGLAEPRSVWLVRAIKSDTIRVVVKATQGPQLDRTSIDLVRLGYLPDAKLEPYFYIWVR